MPVDVTIIAGTRPEAIKLAPVVIALRARGLGVRLVASGQHGELLDGALATFGLKADASLAALQPGQSLGALTSRLIALLAAELAATSPRLVMVQGDTTTAFCGALAAFYAQLPCAHVEAGLRTHDRNAPWPEELNRAMTDRLCTRLYAPTTGARANLLAEGLEESNILVTGQTGVDAVTLAGATLSEAPPEALAMALASRRSKLVFATGHRRENQGGGIGRVAKCLSELAASRNDLTVVYAAHPSAEARQGLQGLKPHDHWRVIEPVDYSASLWLMRAAACVVTDSGGLQEEAPSFGTPVLVTRDATERPEGISAGFLRMAGTDPVKLRATLNAVLDDTGLKARLKATPNPYGDGHAADRIAGDVARILSGSAP